MLRGKYQYRTVATIDKLRTAGYAQPITALEDAVRDYVRTYLVTGTVLGAETGSGGAPLSPRPAFSATR